MNWQLKLQPQASEPLYRQVSRAIREAISSGELRPGERIPSVTRLAKLLAVNRATIVGAFQELERAGLVAPHVGRGTFVAEAPAPKAKSDQPVPRLREGGIRGGLRELLSMEAPPGAINLAAGVPDPRTVPDGTLERLTRQVLAKDPRRLLEYGGPAGLPELRQAVAARLRISPDQILITNGSQQAISLLSCWALEEGRGILCETPTFTGIPTAFLLIGNGVASVPWKEDALDLARVQRSRALLYVCPDHHNPTGRSMSLAGRQEAAAFAAENDVVVVVDEIFRDLRFRGDALHSLYGMLPPGKRILVGSISKSFTTGLRIGWIAADPPLVSELLPYKRYLDLGGPALTQAIAAAFLTDGYDRHLDRVRAYYRERADAAIGELMRRMPPEVAFTHPDGGFQLWVTLPPGASAIQLYLKALEQGVAVSPGPVHDIDGGYSNCFRIGYSHALPEELRTAVGRLAEIVKKQSLAGSSAGLGISL